MISVKVLEKIIKQMFHERLDKRGNNRESVGTHQRCTERNIIFSFDKVSRLVDPGNDVSQVA